MPNAYTYHIKHIPSGMNYYGVRTANKVDPEQDLWNRYFTSSDYVKQLIKQDGLNAFKATVRKEFATKQEAYLYEDRFLRKVKALNNDKWLNKRVGLTFSDEVYVANSTRRRKLNLQPEFRKASSERRRKLNLEPEFNARLKDQAREMVAKLKAEGKTSERTRKGWSPERRLAHIERNKRMNSNPEFKERSRQRMIENNPMKR